MISTLHTPPHFEAGPPRLLAEADSTHDNYQLTLFVCLGLIVVGARSTIAFGAERTWTRSEILSIADNEAKRLGYDVEHLGVTFDFSNSYWLEYFATGRRSGYYPEEWRKIGERLKTQHYWAVLYGGSILSKARPSGIFIDRDSGEIIDHFIPTPYPPQIAGPDFESSEKKDR